MACLDSDVHSALWGHPRELTTNARSRAGFFIFISDQCITLKEWSIVIPTVMLRVPVLVDHLLLVAAVTCGGTKMYSAPR